MKEHYIFKGNLKIKINKSDLSRITGMSRQHIANIINCKITTSKPTAFIITKSIDPNKEIGDYFEKCD